MRISKPERRTLDLAVPPKYLTTSQTVMCSFDLLLIYIAYLSSPFLIQNQGPMIQWSRRPHTVISHPSAQFVWIPFLRVFGAGERDHDCWAISVSTEASGQRVCCGKLAFESRWVRLFLSCLIWDVDSKERCVQYRNVLGMLQHTSTYLPHLT